MRRWFLVLALLSAHSQVSACELEVSHQVAETPRDKLVKSLLELVLSKTDYDFCQKETRKRVTLARETKEVAKGRLRLLWAGSGPSAEEQLRPVRIPVFKGLVGYRVLIIRNGDQERFNKVQNLTDLRQFRAGSGEHWQDRRVLESAEIPLATSSYPQLWPMLKNGRFDFMPFGVHEAWQHFPKHAETLQVEKTILLYYPMAFYFYVHKDDDILYQALIDGMEAATRDGSYDEKLFNSTLVQHSVAKSNLQNRNVIILENPDVPEDTPNDRDEFWIDHEAFTKGILKRRTPTKSF